MNEERLRRLLESTNAVPWEADAETWRFTYVGPQGVSLLGYPLEQWYEEGFWPAHIHEEDRDDAINFCKASSATRADYEFEYRMIASDGRAVWIHDLVNVVADGGVPKLLQGFMIDITERKKAERSARASEKSALATLAELDQLYRTAPVGLCLMGRDLHFVRINERLAAINGKPVAEHIGRAIREVLPEISHMVEPAYRRVIETGEPVLDSEVHGTTPAEPGVPKYWLASYYPLKSEDGTVQGVSTVVQDITERKKSEEEVRTLNYELEQRVQERTQELRQSEAQFEQLLTRSPAVIYRCKTGGDYGATFVGENVKQLTGYEAREFVEEPGLWGSRVHPEDKTRVAVGMDGLFERGGPAVEYRFRHEDGTFRWVRDERTLVRETDGAPIEIVGCWVDITERKEAEERLLRSESNLAQAQRLAHLVNYEYDVKKQEVKWSNWSSETFRILGQGSSKQEPTFKEYIQWIHPEDRDTVQDQIEKAIARKASLDFTYRILTRDGGTKHIRSVGQPVADKKGGVTKILGAILDITERRRVEQELEQTRLSLESAVRAANVGLWDWDLRTNEAYLSPEWKQQLGYDDHEIANRYEEWESRLHPDDRERASAIVKATLETPWPAYEFEFRLRHKDGSYRWILSRASLLFDPEGNPWRLVGAHIDITERKNAQELLQRAHDELEARVAERTKELEEINASLTTEITERKRTEAELLKMSEVFMDAADPIIIRDLGGTIIDLNAEAERAYGWTREELLGQPFQIIVPPERADELEKLQLRCRGGETVRNFEGVRWTKQGRRIVVLTTLSLLSDKEGNPVAVASIAKDITDLKRTEKALRESEERLRLSVEATELAMWDWNILTNEVVRDERSQSLLGLVPEGFEPTIKAVLERLHAGDRERVHHAIARSTQHGIPLEVEFRAVSTAGSVHWLRVQGRTYRNNVGQVHRMVGTTQDITKRKRVEMLQATHNRVLELLAKGRDLAEILNELALSIEDQHQPGIFCTILLLDGDVLRHGAAPNLPREYTQAVDGLKIGPRVGSCGTAAFRKERVVVSDIMTDPLWEDYCELARQFHLGACWSEPIQSESGKVLGTFAMYFGEPYQPGDEELDLLCKAAQLASIAIEHTNAKKAVQQSEAALRESHGRLQELTGQLISAQEEASKQLARELHDDFSQRLAGLLMEVSVLEQKLPSSANGVRERVRGIGDKIGTLAKDINDVSRQLHSSVLDNVGLAAALEAECAGFSEREGIPAEFNSGALPKTLPEDISLCLYRIAQESLRNIGKHANASGVQLRLSGQATDIVLGVRDSGNGFDITGARTKGGLGLVSMEERVRPLGGSLLIESEPGKGTKVEVRIPLRGDNETAENTAGR